MNSCVTFSSCRTHLLRAPQWKRIKFSLVKKGKGKNKGKNKGKKGGWFGMPFGGKNGGGKNGSKSKGKHKGKKGKGKQKGKQKGKGYGGNNNVCRLCGQAGHWGNECPNQVNLS